MHIHSVPSRRITQWRVVKYVNLLQSPLRTYSSDSKAFALESLENRKEMFFSLSVVVNKTVLIIIVLPEELKQFFHILPIKISEYAFRYFKIF